MKGEYAMPIKIPNNLPAVDILAKENIFVMDERRALSQDIRPLKFIIINLMPTKIETETQLLRLLSNTPLQIEVTFLKMASYVSKNISKEHMSNFYKTFNDIKNDYFDGLIITGAPVENMPFEEVIYWKELTEVMEWSRTHVYSTMCICWGAQAGLYYHYGIQKHERKSKLSGVYTHQVLHRKTPLVRSMDDYVNCPHSRYTEVLEEDIAKEEELVILAKSKEAGVLLVTDRIGRQIFVQGHPEYDRMSLSNEYHRDVAKGLSPAVPINYFEDNNPANTPVLTWRNFSNTLYANWLNFYVYQSTPYELKNNLMYYI